VVKSRDGEKLKSNMELENVLDFARLTSHDDFTCQASDLTRRNRWREWKNISLASPQMVNAT
jgi:hypothetical protein